jgi:hypothetical protein
VILGWALPLILTFHANIGGEAVIVGNSRVGIVVRLRISNVRLCSELFVATRTYFFLAKSSRTIEYVFSS